MESDLTTIIREHARPLRPLPTAVAARLTQLPGIRAVLFDIYGTMLVSGSGDVGTAQPQQTAAAAVDALASVGLTVDADVGSDITSTLERVIAQHHQQAAACGIDFPEVDIRTIWRTTLEQLANRGRLPDTARQLDMERLAMHYEVRANPTWPMPELAETLTALHAQGQMLGIISNAQFYTPPLFLALTGRSLEQWGFAADLQVYSYRLGQAKPALRLFTAAADALRARGITNREVLYIGNDMRNDVAGAQQLGFQTVLFAGDQRSLRLRPDDVRVVGVHADAIITSLTQLCGCLSEG